MNKIILMSFSGVLFATTSLVYASGPDISEYASRNSAAGSGSDFVCNDSFTDRVNERIKQLIPNVCSQLDTSTSLEGNPFAYDNPNAFCDVGQSMVGQPSWDGVKFDVDAPDACGIAKMVVGDHVRGAVSTYNEYNDMVNSALSISGGVDAGGALESILGN